MSQEYRLGWKAERGYYDHDRHRWLSDEESDWWEREKHQHQEALALSLPKTDDSWRRAFDLLPPLPKSRIDKDEVKSRVDMLDLIGRYGVQKIRTFGKRATGLCPFHNEKTASFSVDLDRKLWYCFSESRGGDCFTFIQEAEDCTFAEAVRTLNRTY